MNSPVQKSLDIKLARILADPSCNDFILADAKDADMAGGMAAPGRSPEHHSHEGRYRTLAEYRQLMRDNVSQGLIDIMLMSASSNEILTIHERLFDDSHVTPAARANDTSDIMLALGGAVYPSQPSRPFRSATIDHIMCGKIDCGPAERTAGADLGLYSMTFNNDVDLDLAQLNAYRDFRIEAERKGFRHFLEIFNPNAPQSPIPDLPRYLNDMIAKTLAGVVGRGRPIFLKIPYHGPAAMEQLAAYDRTLIPGILGGSSGTTFDAFHQLAEAKKHGARAALYGRMINNSEHQPTFIQHLRWIADGQITDAAEGVRSYHASLEKLGVNPYRALAEDLMSLKREAAYSGTSVRIDGGKAEPDFATMSRAEKIAWNMEKWNRILK